MLTEDAERLVIRPDREAYWRWAGASPLIALLALGAGSLRLALSHQVVPMYVLWAFAAVAVVSIWSYFHSARIELRDDHILRVGLYGLRKHVKKEDMRGVAYRVVRVALAMRSQKFAIFYGDRHRILLKVNTDFWSSDELRELTQRLGLAGGDFKILSRRRFNREFPAGENIVARHPNAAGILGALAFTAGIMAVIALGER